MVFNEALLASGRVLLICSSKRNFTDAKGLEAVQSVDTAACEQAKEP